MTDRRSAAPPIGESGARIPAAGAPIGLPAIELPAIELHAIDAARGIRRRWRVAASRDLFGHVVVETGWGRIGARGRTLTRSFADAQAAHAYVAALLRRRAGARARIGVDYVRVG